MTFWTDGLYRVCRTSGLRKTHERYASIARHHLKPDLGNVILSKLQPLQIEAAYTKWMKTGRKKKDLEGPQDFASNCSPASQGLQGAQRWPSDGSSFREIRLTP